MRPCHAVVLCSAMIAQMASAQTLILSPNPPTISHAAPGTSQYHREMIALGWEPATDPVTGKICYRQEASRPAAPFANRGSSSWTQGPPSSSADPSYRRGDGGAASCRYCNRKVRVEG